MIIRLTFGHYFPQDANSSCDGNQLGHVKGGICIVLSVSSARQAMSIEAVRIATVECGGIDDSVRNYEPR